MEIRDYMQRGPVDGDLAKPCVGLFTSQNALQEAELLGVKLDALTSTVAVLFEMRTSLQVRECDAGVLVARGVGDLSCALSHRQVQRTAWSVVGSEISNEGDYWHFACFFSPDLSLRVQAQTFSFYAGKVPGIPTSLPDYLSDSDELVKRGIAAWDSSFVLRHYESVGGGAI